MWRQTWVIRTWTWVAWVSPTTFLCGTISLALFSLIYSYALGVEADMSDKDSDLGSMSLLHCLSVSDSSHRLCPSTAFGDMSDKDSDLGSMSLYHQLPVWNYFFGTIFIDIFLHFRSGSRHEWQGLGPGQYESLTQTPSVELFLWHYFHWYMLTL